LAWRCTGDCDGAAHARVGVLGERRAAEEREHRDADAAEADRVVRAEERDAKHGKQVDDEHLRFIMIRMTWRA